MIEVGPLQSSEIMTALHATERSIVDVGEKNMEGRHVGLDFYDLLIEVKSGYFNRCVKGLTSSREAS